MLGVLSANSVNNGFFCGRPEREFLAARNSCVIVNPIETDNQTIRGAINHDHIYIYKTHLCFQSNKATKFLLENVGLYLPNLTFYEVNNCSIEILKQKHFANMTNLETLSLANNLIKNVPNEVFSDLKMIKSLNLSGNKLGSSNKTFLTSMTSLQVLDLSTNNIKKFWLKRLKTLVNLEWFFMSNNQLETLNNTSFAENTNLSWIKLDGNRIKALEVNIFENLSKLKYVNLTGNACGNSSFGSENHKSLMQMILHLNKFCQPEESIENKNLNNSCQMLEKSDKSSSGWSLNNYSFLIIASLSLCLYILILILLCLFIKMISSMEETY